MTRPPQTKLLKPSAQQAMLYRRLTFLERTIGPMVQVNWEIPPTRQELAEYARGRIEYMYQSRGKQFSKASCNAQVTTGQQARWDKAEKARGPKNGEIVRDKFPQAFKDAITALATTNANTKAK